MHQRFKSSQELINKMSETCGKRGWWTKYSEIKLAEVENTILSVVKTTFRTWFVNIGDVVGKDDKIWTIALNEETENTPLVMLHGFAAGIGFWCKNFDDIAETRPVYAIDLLGFGRSSRPSFAKNCEKAEEQWVCAIEEWRKQVNLDKFILLGHSFGGYLATSYAIAHPERVRHLILADPWGFEEKPINVRVPLRFKVAKVVLFPLLYLNPLATIRAMGPLGPALVRKVRGDIAQRYEDLFESTEVITEYIYQCNSQYPSGESAFHSFLQGIGWSKNPMIHRYDQIKDSVPITVVYGNESWLNPSPGLILREKRQDVAYVNVGLIPDAGHHLYSDQPKLFNQIVKETCEMVDDNQDQKGMMDSLEGVKHMFNYEEVKQFIEMKSRNRLKMPDEETEETIEQNEQKEVTSQ